MLKEILEKYRLEREREIKVKQARCPHPGSYISLLLDGTLYQCRLCGLAEPAND